MHFNPSSLVIFATTLPLLASLSSASPVLDVAQRRDTVPSGSYYTVERLPWDGVTPVPHEGEYLYPYSTGTGPGTTVAAFTSDKTLAVKGYITETTTFELGIALSAFPWTMQIPSSNVSAAVPVTIEANATTPGTVGFGYSIGAKPGLWTSAVAGFDGFFACDTSLNITQLFGIIRYGRSYSIPSGCAEIQLDKAN
ncbi:hypothetical protein L228DRAFT_251219 [Xylona heveae TC161]|uniref:DUF7907 domain-containing protein n=1 Tax=Xylona heveae (strain CBS 132557 / TC161) TaxID=1328760 RepID=A0A164ZI84_XYLHT|nr:hypothetical protein L228DRAFT_251219 [Xylona heveae TC161]KZF19129.1 hypothetical protein L228DRAFT_251219 [Xylona heveae TC161]